MQSDSRREARPWSGPVLIACGLLVFCDAYFELPPIGWLQSHISPALGSFSTWQSVASFWQDMVGMGGGQTELYGGLGWLAGIFLGGWVFIFWTLTAFSALLVAACGAAFLVWRRRVFIRIANGLWYTGLVALIVPYFAVFLLFGAPITPLNTLVAIVIIPVLLEVAGYALFRLGMRALRRSPAMPARVPSRAG